MSIPKISQGMKYDLSFFLKLGSFFNFYKFFLYSGSFYNFYKIYFNPRNLYTLS
jgi:hypothetical protein